VGGFEAEIEADGDPSSWSKNKEIKREERKRNVTYGESWALQPGGGGEYSPPGEGQRPINKGTVPKGGSNRGGKLPLGDC